MSIGVSLERVREVVVPILKSLGFELVDLAFLRGPKGILRIYIDKEGGITLEDCAQASRFISHALDVEDPISHPYHLEVSSPGLDRPLKRLEDFDRYRGRTVKIVSDSTLYPQKVFIGILQGRNGENIRVELEKNETVEIPFRHILKARLKVEF